MGICPSPSLWRTCRERPVSLGVRTLASQAGITGSSPVRATKKNGLPGMRKAVFFCFSYFTAMTCLGLMSLETNSLSIVFGWFQLVLRPSRKGLGILSSAHEQGACLCSDCGVAFHGCRYKEPDSIFMGRATHGFQYRIFLLWSPGDEGFFEHGNRYWV